MKRIRNYSISGSKYFILGVIFLVTVIITFISMKFETVHWLTVCHHNVVGDIDDVVDWT